MLSDTAIRNAKPQSKAYKKSDERGLYLFIQPTGGKLWRFDYRFNDKRKTLSIGKYPDVTLADARVKLDQSRKMLIAGVDPSIDKKQSKIQKVTDSELTFKKVATDWLTLKSKTLAPTTYEKISKCFKANVYGRLGNLPIKEIVYSDVRACLLVMQKRGALDYMHKTRGWIKTVFDFAVNDGLMDRSPISASDDRLEKQESNNYPHFLTMDDAGKFLRNLSDYKGSIEVQLCAYLMLHVAQRPSELRKAKWCEFDFDTKIWTLPLIRSKTKNHMEKPHTIMLSTQVVKKLQYLNQFTGHQEYLFKSRLDDKPLSEASVRLAFRVSFLDYHTVPHGCRHVFSTNANESQLFREAAIEAMIQHKVKDATKASLVYNHAIYNRERKQIAQWWSNELDKVQFSEVCS